MPRRASPYNTGYQYARARLLASHPPCYWRCGRPATQADHVPSLLVHAHRPGSGCCVLVPACQRCNQGHRVLVAAPPRASRAW